MLLLRAEDIIACAAAVPALCDPFVMSDNTRASSRSIRFCISSGVPFGPAAARLFLRLLGAAYVQEGESPRLVQLSQGCPRLHFSFRCLQGAQDNGTRFLFRTMRNWELSGDAPVDELVEGGVTLGFGMMYTVAETALWPEW